MPKRKITEKEKIEWADTVETFNLARVPPEEKVVKMEFLNNFENRLGYWGNATDMREERLRIKKKEDLKTFLECHFGKRLKNEKSRKESKLRGVPDKRQFVWFGIREPNLSKQQLMERNYHIARWQCVDKAIWNYEWVDAEGTGLHSHMILIGKTKTINEKIKRKGWKRTGNNPNPKNFGMNFVWEENGKFDYLQGRTLDNDKNTQKQDFDTELRKKYGMSDIYVKGFKHRQDVCDFLRQNVTSSIHFVES